MKPIIVFVATLFIVFSFSAASGRQPGSNFNISSTNIVQTLPDAKVAVETDVVDVTDVVAGVCSEEEAEPRIVPEAGYSMNPYCGEVFRPVLDLELWGSVGALTFRHYEGQKLRSPSQFSIIMKRSYSSSGPDNYRVTIAGGGRSYNFKSAGTGIWKIQDAGSAELIQDGLIYFLHTADGYRFRFEEFVVPKSTCSLCLESADKCPNGNNCSPCLVNCFRYQLQDFVDPFLREFRLIYNNQKKLIAVYGGTVPIHNYSWGMRRFVTVTKRPDGSVEADSLRTTIASPEGKLYYFKGNSSGTWETTFKGQGAQLFQEETNYFLQTPDGFRYRFAEIPLVQPPLDCSACFEKSSYCANCAATQEKPCLVRCYRYQLRAFKDPFQNEYKLTYNDDEKNKRLVKIEDAGGSRYFELKYNADKKLSTVNTKDGRSVQYNYNSDGIFSGVSYGDQSTATYDFNFDSTKTTIHFRDPRFEGTTSNMKVITYYSTPANPLPAPVVTMKNGLTDIVMDSLDNRSVDKKLSYSNGRKQTYNMPKPYLLKSYTDGTESKTDYEYDQGEEGYLKSEKDAINRTISYERTKYGNPTLITYPGNNGKETWERDNLDLVTTYKNRMGHSTKYNRDPQKHYIKSIEYLVDNSSESFNNPNEFGQYQEHVGRNGRKEKFVYEGGLLKNESFVDTETDPELKATPYNLTYDYDANGLLKIIPNARPGNFTTAFEYYESGLPKKMTNPGGSVQEYKYDEFGNRTEFTNEIRKVWKTDYDEFKRPTKIYTPISARPPTTYSYVLPRGGNLPGGINGCCYTEAKPTLITLPSGKKTEIGYDVEWREVRKTVGFGTADQATTGIRRDKVGRPEWTADPKGKLWHRLFDEMDRVVEESDPLGNKTGYTYDNADRINVITQGGGTQNIKHTYDDVRHRETTTVNQLGQQPQTSIVKEFDAEGNMVKLTDGNHRQHIFRYDQLNHLRKRIYPDRLGLNEKYEYDEAGNLITYHNRAGNIRRFNYDGRNRLKTAIWDGIAAPAVTYEYDDANRVKSIANGVSTITYEYNDANEVVSETQAVGYAPGSPKVMTYTYNNDGLRETVTYPSNYVLKYNYTGRNQIGSINEVQNNVRIANYKYDLNGNRKLKELSNKTYVEYTYDDANRLTTIENKTGTAPTARLAETSEAVSVSECGTRVDYGYDNLNRVKYVQRNLDRGDVYEYDALDQVTNVQFNVFNPDGNPSSPDSAVSYVLDAVGNRVSVTKKVFTDTAKTGRLMRTASQAGANSNIAYSINELNQYYVINGQAVLYTPNGNLTSWDGWTYTYDAEDRMTKAEKAIDGKPYVILFFYDALNRCVRRLVNDQQTFFYYDGEELIEERNSLDDLLARYTYGADPGEKLVLVTTDKSNYPIHAVYYHHDKDGSVSWLSDGQGRPVEWYEYGDFGAAKIYFRPDSHESSIIAESQFGNHFMFHGEEYVGKLNLYRIGDRMYSPDEKFGRFLQADPSNINSYIYAGNSPINRSNYNNFHSASMEALVEGLEGAIEDLDHTKEGFHVISHVAEGYERLPGRLYFNAPKNSAAVFRGLAVLNQLERKWLRGTALTPKIARFYGRWSSRTPSIPLSTASTRGVAGAISKWSGRASYALSLGISTYNVITAEDKYRALTVEGAQTLAWLGGAAAGAAIGSFVPIVGTVIGGVVGGIAGSWAGHKVGEGAYDYLYDPSTGKVTKYFNSY